MHQIPSRIYIRLPNWIGDVCMSIPSLQAVIRTGCETVVCAKPWAKSLLSGFDNIRLIEFDGRWKLDRRLVRADLQERPSPKPVGLLLPDSLTSALSFRFAGLPCGGYRDDFRSILLKWPTKKPTVQQHAVESWYHLTRTLLGTWGLSCSADIPGQIDYPVSEKSQASAGEYMLQHNLAPKQFVVIAPTATGLHHGKSKVWPHYETLTKALQSEGIRVIMTVPPREKEQAIQNAPSAELLPPLALDAFACVLDQASLVICNDSGVSHLSTLTETPSLTLVGATNPQRTGPWGPHARILGKEGCWPEISDVLSQTKTILQAD